MPTTSQTLALAVEHHQSGRLRVAEEIYRQILQSEPNHADAIHLLGVLAHQQGNLDEAVVRYRRAVDLNPGFAAAHGNLGVALKDLGRLDEAAAACRRSIELRPDLAEAHGNLGVVLTELGKPEEAVACCRRALELKPDQAEIHNNLGVALKDIGRLEEAATCYRRAIELQPGYAESHNNLGVVAKEQGKLDEAIACYHRALEVKPDYPAAESNLGNALKEQGKFDEAIACYQRAIQQRPDFAEAHGNLGGALEEMGDLKAAENALRAAVACNPRFAFAHYKLAELLRGRLAEADLAALRRLLDQRDLPNAQQLLLHFGLAQVLDGRGEYTEAAAHLERGNDLQLAEWRQRGQGYDPVDHEALVGGMISTCTADFFRRVRDFGLDSELPVFVVGLPPSGTTLIEQILASHSQVYGAGEIKAAEEMAAALGSGPAALSDALGRLDRADGSAIGRGVSEAALHSLPDQAAGHRQDAGELLALGFLATLFPRAKFIHCRRDLRDVAVSCWMTHFREVRWANDRKRIASRFGQYRRLMEHWRKVLPAPLLEVDYEDTVVDLEGVARRLVGWCGLEWEPACLEFHRVKRPVSTASVVQVREPVFRASVGRWRHYERTLGDTFATLGGLAPCEERSIII